MCRVEKDFYRCVLIKDLGGNEYSVLLADVGGVESVRLDNLFTMEYSFHGDANNYAYALRCCTPGSYFCKKK